MLGSFQIGRVGGKQAYRGDGMSFSAKKEDGHVVWGESEFVPFLYYDLCMRIYSVPTLPFCQF